MEQKRILILLSRFLDGGIDSVLVEYLSYLAAQPHCLITLAIGMNYRELEVYSHRIPSNVQIVHLVNSPLLTTWRKHKLSRPLPFYVKAFDEVLLNPIRRKMMLRKIGKLAAQSDVIIDFDCCAHSFIKNISKPKIGFFHFSIKQVLQGNVQRIRRMERTIACYNKFVTISKAMRQEALELFPDMRDRFEMIYNGIDLNELRSKAMAQTDNTLINEPYILSVSRLEESQKDVSTLLRAYATFRSNYVHTEQLLIIGKGKSEEQLRDLAEQLGISNSVHFLGFCANPYPWISRCKLYVQSSKFEGLPTTLIEALLLDKDIVATDCPTGPREILSAGEAGLLTPVGDVGKMAAAMHDALCNESVRQHLADGRRVHKGQFTMEKAGGTLLELIERT